MSVFAHQAAGLTVLDDLPFEHDHAVEIAQGRKPVRDRDHGAAPHQTAERLANGFFGFTVQRRGRLVKQQDRRILEERARDGDALTLAAGEFDAAIANHGRQASGRLSTKSQRAAIAARSTSLSVAVGRP